MENPVSRVLLIEEDREVAKDLAMQLSCFNHQVRAVDYSADIRHHLNSFAPESVLLDVDAKHSGNAGGEVLAIAREYCDRTGAPLFFISGQSHFDVRLAVIRAGGKALFHKPVDVGQVVERLEALVLRQPEDPFRVLVVEDSLTMAKVYSATLEQAGMKVRWVTDPKVAPDALEDFSAELVLTDLHMPGCTGIELAAILRQQPHLVGVPIVFLSCETDLSRHQAAMENGADDFLLKPIDGARLVSAVSTRARRYRELRSHMLKDSLTGLLNHTTIKELLDREVSRAKRSGKPLSFAMVDIDHFKRVNDSYGHPAGDQVICSLSRLLRQRLRKTDLVGRYGGEEFAVVLPETDALQAARVMDEIRATFERLRQNAGGQEFHATISCGIAQWDDEAVSATEAADRALYQAKHGGRNRVCLAQPTVVRAQQASGG